MKEQYYETVLFVARSKEPNNTVMNLISKAREPEYQPFGVELFTRSDIPFAFHDPIHNYLYLNGILSSRTEETPLPIGNGPLNMPNN